MDEPEPETGSGCSDTTCFDDDDGDDVYDPDEEPVEEPIKIIEEADEVDRELVEAEIRKELKNNLDSYLTGNPEFEKLVAKLVDESIENAKQGGTL